LGQFADTWTPNEFIVSIMLLNWAWNGEEIHELTGIDPWFLDKLADLMETEKFLKRTPLKSLGKEDLFAH
jgi:hypothetical protein